MVDIARTHIGAQLHGGIAFFGGFGTKGFGLFLGNRQQAFYIHAHNGGRHNTKERQGGKAAADVRGVDKGFAEVVFFG